MKTSAFILSSFSFAMMGAGLGGFCLAAPGDSASARTVEERLEAIEARLQQLETRVNRAHSWGAFELTTRYSELNVDKNAFPLFANARTSARKAQAWAGGLNWYFNRSARFTVNYEHTFFKDGGTAGNRQTEKAIMTRFQLTY